VSTLEGIELSSYELGDRSYFEAEGPGLYLAANDKERLHVAVNVNVDNTVDPNTPRVSEEDRRNTPIVQAETGGSVAWTEAWIGLLLLAVGLLMLEWWLYHKRWTI
jgi:hypothetical protein